jgi:hypothetical protein
MRTLTVDLEEGLTRILKVALHRRSSTAEELAKQAFYQYLGKEQATEDELTTDSIVGMFDLGDPLLSEKVEDILWR